MNEKYEKIIDLPHHVSTTRQPMTNSQRAVQFSPFAALTGYEDAVNETARLTDSRIELDENEISTINDRLQLALENIALRIPLEITYFKPDSKKDGGCYVTATGLLKKLNESEREVVLCDGTHISIDEIFSISGEMFRESFDR